MTQGTEASAEQSLAIERALASLKTGRLEAELADLSLVTDINLAHVTMLGQCDILAPPVVNRLTRKLLDIDERGIEALGSLAGQDGLYLAYEASLIDELGLDVGGAIHTARSRNDLGATISRMKTRARLLDVLDAALQLRAAFVQKAATCLDTVITGYTHQQPAQPITFAHWLLAFENALARDCRRLDQAFQCANELPLGSCALAGTDFPIDQELTASLLGFPSVLDNSLDAVATRDYALEASAAFAILATTLSRFAHDLQLWYTHEYGYIGLTGPLSGGSSIMPQKKNPVVFEVLKGRSAHILANLTAMLVGQKNTSYTNVIDVNRESVRAFPEAIDSILLMLHLATATVNGVELNAERMYRQAEKNFASVTLLANYLVREKGYSFRAAYQLVKGVVEAALARGLNSNQVTTELVDEIAGTPLQIPSADIQEMLDPRSNVTRLRYGGGPNSERNVVVLANRRTRIDADTARLAQSRAKLEQAREGLYDMAHARTA